MLMTIEGVFLLSGVAAGVVPACLAVAQPAPPAPEPAWSASAEISLWRPAIQDDLGLPGAGTIVLQDHGLNDNEITPLVTATLTRGDWTIELAGFDFETTGGGASASAFTLGSVSVGAGATFGAEVDYTSLWLSASKQVWAEEVGNDSGLALHLGGGLRVSDLRVQISSGGAGLSDDEVWAEALAVARLSVTLPRDLSFDIHGDAGGGFDSTAWSIGARVRWQPEPYLGAQFGYRFQRTDLDDDGFRFDGALAGLYAGFTIEF